jgi:hypothetical protein
MAVNTRGIAALGRLGKGVRAAGTFYANGGRTSSSGGSGRRGGGPPHNPRRYNQRGANIKEAQWRALSRGQRNIAGLTRPEYNSQAETRHTSRLGGGR